MRRPSRLPALLAPAALALAGASAADVIHLDDGRRIEGVVVGEAEGVVTIQTGREQEEVPAERVVRVEEAPVDEWLQRRAERGREQWVKRRQRAATGLLRDYDRADAEERARIEGDLDRFDPALLLDPLERALDDRRDATRALAVRRLEAIGGEDALVRLLRAVLTTDRDDVEDAGHAAAVRVDATRTRELYEEVAATPTKASRRYRAIQRLAAMGGRDAVPGLVYALEQVQSELHVAQARAKDLRSAPLDLGTGTGAGTNVPVELPQVELFEINTTTSVAALRALSRAAAAALREVTGEDRGEDPAAWKAWWAAQGGGAGDH